MELNVTEIGIVDSTWIAPVKGMQGLYRPSIELKSGSIVGDRRVAYNRVGYEGNPPSYLVSDQFPDILKYAARFKDDQKPNGQIIVTTPEGEEFDAWSKDLLAEMLLRFGEMLDPVTPGRNTNHSMPVSVTTIASLNAIEREANQDLPLDKRRFRNSIYVATYDPTPFTEPDWVNRVLIFGNTADSARVNITRQDRRCKTVSLHPETAIEDERIHDAIRKNHGNYLGDYGNVLREGTISIGDKVYLSEEIEFNLPK